MKTEDKKLNSAEQALALINRNSLLLLLLLTGPAVVMASVLFLWPDVTWMSETPYIVVEALGSFVALLLAIFVLARYRDRAGILYFSAGLIAMATINGFLIVSRADAGLYFWLNSFAGILGGFLFILYLMTNNSNTPVYNPGVSAKDTALVLGGTTAAAFIFSLVSVIFAGDIPVVLQNGHFTAIGWLINSIPTLLFLGAGSVLFYRYRKTGGQELLLCTAIVIFLFQTVEAQYFTSMWSIIWWLWQGLRLVVYLAGLTYVLLEYVRTSESLSQEIAGREKVQTALEQAEADWRNSFNALDEAMFIINRDYTIERMNRSGYTLIDKKKAEIPGKKCHELLRSRAQVCVGCPLKAVLRSKKTSSAEYHDEVLNRHFAVKAAPVLDEKHRVLKCAYIMRDITGEYKAKEKEKRLQQELNLSSRLASIGEVAAGIAHEINNPITGVIGFAEMLSRGEVPEHMREGIEVIQDGARRTASIVQKLLTFARQNKMVKEYVDINAILKGSLDLRSYEMKVNNIEIVSQLEPALPRTIANFGQLQQVFLNLIVNAEQAMKMAGTGGKLTVRTETVGNLIRVTVSDTGVGIPKENLNKLFDPFFTTKGDCGGTGLGLSISYGIIQEHKGKIKVKSQPDKGTHFTVDLPLLAPAAEPEKLPLTTAEIKEKSVTEKNILVIDDEANICRVLYRLLSSAGYRVETVSDAREAMEKLQDASFDLILLDIKMPGMSGIDFYEQIKSIHPDLPGKIICITGDTISIQNREFLEKARLPYVTKPFSVDDLINEVKSSLGGKNAKETSAYSG